MLVAPEALVTALDPRCGFLFLPDGKSLLVGGEEPPIRLCDFPSGKVLRTFSEAGLPRDVTPDGKLALVTHRMRGLELWDVAQGKLVRTFSPSAMGPACFSPDGTRVFAPDNVPDKSNAVAVWDTASGELRLMLAGADGWKYPLAFSPDDHLAVSESSLSLEPGEKSTLALWDWTTGQERRVFEKRQGGRAGVTTVAQATAFTPDGKAVVTLDYDQMLRRWSVATDKAMLQVSLEAEHPSVYALTKDGRMAVTTGDAQDGLWKGVRFTLWDTTTGSRIRTVIPERRP
jgi:WD40 repeat protein